MPTPDEIRSKVVETIAKSFKIEPDQVSDDKSFQDDLGADSLEIVELVMALEEEFGIEISDEEAEKIRTVGDAIKFITERAAA
ncbi:MAG: acyl carrier protein [Acidobacteria bacterium]|nr:MAG: acyl carrier protein [Acidobacteriota bacterium]